MDQELQKLTEKKETLGKHGNSPQEAAKLQSKSRMIQKKLVEKLQKD